MRLRPVHLILLVPLLAGPVLLSGCTMPDNPFRSLDDPMGRTTFQDAGSNETTWSLRLAGHFYLPEGVRFRIDHDNATCATSGLVTLTNNTTLACRTASEDPLYMLHFHDRDGDGRLSREDRFEIRAQDEGDAVLNGTYQLTLGLHEELPLFVLHQRFHVGPTQSLHVELLA